MDSCFSQLHSDGIGASKKSAGIINFDDEQLLWDNGVLGLDSPNSLFHTVFFYVGLHFCLRGGQEQRDLCLKQFLRSPSNTDIYNENSY